MANKKTIVIIIIVLGLVLVAGISTVSTVQKINSPSGYGLGGDVSMRNNGTFSESSLPSPVATSNSKMMAGESAVAPAFDAESQDLGVTDKKVIKNGDLSLKVYKVDGAVTDIAKIAKDNGGEIFSSNFYQNTTNIKSGSLTVKVPVNNFEKSYDAIKKVASLVMRESTSGQDVTEQYTDLQSRLKNKQAEEQSYLRILDQAQKIDDILAVTRQLSQVRGEIEVMQGRIRLMDSQTDMATITVSLSEDPQISLADTWRPWQIVKNSINSLIKDIQSFVTFLLVLIIRIIPVIILYLLLVLIIYLVGRKIYIKVKAKNETPQ
jgi:hypothetical protein